MSRNPNPEERNIKKPRNLETDIWKYMTVHKEDRAKMRQDPEEKSWSLAMLTDYPVPFECIAVLLDVQSLRRRSKRSLLSVREARWVVRVYQSIMSSHKYRGNMPVNTLRNVDFWSYVYANYELASKMGKLVDFTELDWELFESGGYIEKTKQWQSAPDYVRREFGNTK
jgi:hypothetical protein